MNTKKEEPDFFTTLLNAGIAHYQKEAIVKALDYVAGLSGEEVKDLTLGMAPEQVARVYRVWQACKTDAAGVLRDAARGGLPHD